MTSKENLLASIIHLIYSNDAYYWLSIFLSLIQSIYLHFDSDQSGTMSSHELRLALKAAGSNFSDWLLQYVTILGNLGQYLVQGKRGQVFQVCSP